MIGRAALLAILVTVEGAIAVESVIAVRGDQRPPAAALPAAAQAASGANLVEGGPHRSFTAGTTPALTVDIGNADLTIRTGDADQFDVAVSKSTAFGYFRATAPITARKDGAALRIGTTDTSGWSMGDDRMVTVVVPVQTMVTVVQAGDIRAIGLRAESSFDSANGRITIEDYAAPALRVAASKGRIALFRVAAARLDVSSAGGRIEGTALQARDGSIDSRDGRVTLTFAPGTDTLVTAQTSKGTVSVSGAWAADTGTPPADGDDSATRTVRIGAGAGRLDVHASHGNISLSQ